MSGWVGSGATALSPKKSRAAHGATAWLRRPPLAVRKVLHGGARSLVAISGMALAVVMVLLQLGFLEAVRVTAAINYDQLDFDVAVLSAEFEQFYNPGGFPRERLPLARSARGRRSASCLDPDESVALPAIPLDGP